MLLYFKVRQSLKGVFTPARFASDSTSKGPCCGPSGLVCVDVTGSVATGMMGNIVLVGSLVVV